MSVSTDGGGGDVVRVSPGAEEVVEVEAVEQALWARWCCAVVEVGAVATLISPGNDGVLGTVIVFVQAGQR